MINEEQFVSLLQCMESETLDFKAKEYDLTNDEDKFSLVKDVLCMANTPRETSSFLVLGVKKYPDGTYNLRGLETYPDENDIQSQFTERVYSIPSFTYNLLTYSGKRFGVIEIPPIRTGPCVPIRDFGNALRQRQIYFRRGTKNDIATPEDAAQILSWLGKQITPRGAYEDGGPSWESLLRELQNFDPARYYVLIVSPCVQDPLTDLSALGRIPWVGVFDFDSDSDSQGVFSASKAVLEGRRSIHLVTPHDRPTLNLRTGSYWFFARGLAGREGTVERGPWQTWKRVLGAGLTEHFRRLAAACAPTPMTCLALWYDTSLARHLRSALDAALESFGDTANIVIVTDDLADLQPIAADVGATLLEIPLHQLCSGMSSFFGVEPGITEGGFSLPSSSGAPISVAAQDQNWLEEELDIVHLGVGLVPPPDRSIGREFLRGSEISWYELVLSH